MTRFSLALPISLALATPAFANPSVAGSWAWWAEWLDICTTDRKIQNSEVERLKACLVIEQQLRDQGRCMYSPGVIGIWNGKHCR